MKKRALEFNFKGGDRMSWCKPSKRNGVRGAGTGRKDSGRWKRLETFPVLTHTK